MSDLREAAYWLQTASRGERHANRHEVVMFVMRGEDPEVIAQKDVNYRAWVDVILSIAAGALVCTAQRPKTRLRRMERGFEDVLKEDLLLPADLQLRTARALQETRIAMAAIGDYEESHVDLVYAFRTPAREGIRIGETTRGWARLRDHVRAYRDVQPVALFCPPRGAAPRKLQDDMLTVLYLFRDGANQDWHPGIDDELVFRVALNHGATLSIHSDEIWKRALT